MGVKNTLKDILNISFFVGSLFGGLSIPGAFADMSPVIEKLDNGLELVWFSSPDLPVLDLSFVVRAGFRDDPDGKSGTSALVLSMLDRGNSGKTRYESTQAIETLGMARALSAEDDQMLIHFHGLSTDSDTMVQSLAGLVTKPGFDEKEFDTEKSRILERWENSEDLHEFGSAVIQHRVLASGTPYARGSMSSLKELKRVSRSDLITYYKKYFVPENSLLVISGKYDPVDLKAKISKAFGNWSPEGSSKKGIKHSEKQYQETRLSSSNSQKEDLVYILDRPGGTQATLKLGYLVPKIESQYFYPLLVLNAILGEYFNSRLTTMLRDKLGLTYGVESTVSFNKGMGELTITSSARNEVIGVLIEKAQEVVKNILLEPVTAEELEAAKKYVVGNFSVTHASPATAIRRWLNNYLLGLPEDSLSSFVEKTNAVSLDDIKKVAERYFKVGRKTILLSGDMESLRQTLLDESPSKGSRKKIRKGREF